MKTKLFFASLLLLAAGSLSAQTVKSQIVENGGTGAYKAEVVSDESLPAFTIYRPQNIKSVVAKEGKLPILLYANGGCSNDNIQMRFLLNEVVSHGYLAIAIGPYNEDSVLDNWRDVIIGMYPPGKKVVLANGEEVKELSPEELQARNEKIRAAREEAMKAAAKNRKKNEPVVQPFRTYPRQLLEALDWLTDQTINPESEYYQVADLDQVAVMGQSCGGAMALSVAHDPRVKSYIILNSGMGEISMSGASRSNLANYKYPVFYLCGGPTDIAYNNAIKDYANINHVPVVMANTLDGHHGTYYEANGGDYAKAVYMWLDWRLKGQVAQSAAFLNPDYGKFLFPTWTIEHKGF